MDIKELARAYESGQTLEALASQVGVSRQTVTRLLREVTKIRGPGLGKPKPRPLGPEWDDLGEVPDEELAKRIGCTRQNVAGHRKRRGIPHYLSTKRSKHGRGDNANGTDGVR